MEKSSTYCSIFIHHCIERNFFHTCTTVKYSINAKKKKKKMECEREREKVNMWFSMSYFLLHTKQRFLSPCTSSTQTCTSAEAQCPPLAHSWTALWKHNNNVSPAINEPPPIRTTLTGCSPPSPSARRRCDCGKPGTFGSVSARPSHTSSPLLVSVIAPQAESKFTGACQHTPDELSAQSYKSQKAASSASSAL